MSPEPDCSPTGFGLDEPLGCLHPGRHSLRASRRTRLPHQLEQLPVHEGRTGGSRARTIAAGARSTYAFRGDVEIIVSKTLEKDKATALRVRRAIWPRTSGSYLRGEAIRAQPASAFYQLRKVRSAATRAARSPGRPASSRRLLAGTVVSIVFALRPAENARVADGHAQVRPVKRSTSPTSSKPLCLDRGSGARQLSHHDVVDAARQLEEAPEEIRGWEWRHLRTRLDDSTTVLPAAAGEVQLLIRDSQAIRIAALARDGLRLIDLEGNEVLTRSFSHESHLINQTLAPMRYRLRLAAGDREREARISAVERSPDKTTNVVNLVGDPGHGRISLQAPPGTQAEVAAVSPDGSRLAVVWSKPNQWVFTLHDPESGKLGVTSSQDVGDTWDLAFNPNGTRLATAGEDGLARLWDTSTGLNHTCPIIEGVLAKVRSVAFRPDGQRLVTTSADGTVRQWDATTGREAIAPYERHIGDVVTAVYSPDGLWIASAGTDRTIRVWEAANRHDVAVLHGHTGVVTDLAFTADGRRLASASQSGRQEFTCDGAGASHLEVTPECRRVRAARPHRLHLSGGLQPWRGQWIASGGAGTTPVYPCWGTQRR